MATSAPSAASAFAIPAPIPLLAPVTRARFPTSAIAIILLCRSLQKYGPLIWNVNYFMYWSSQKAEQMTVIGRPREFDRDVALQEAMLVFWRKGFLATSMNDLCDAMGVRSPSLYAAFGGKEALYLEAVEHYVERFGPPIWDRLSEGTTAREGVEELLLAATKSLPESKAIPGGCMATLAGLGDEWPAGIAEVVAKS